MEIIRRIGRNQYYTETKFLGIWMRLETKRIVIDGVFVSSILAGIYAILYV